MFKVSEPKNNQIFYSKADAENFKYHNMQQMHLMRIPQEEFLNSSITKALKTISFSQLPPYNSLPLKNNDKSKLFCFEFLSRILEVSQFLSENLLLPLFSQCSRCPMPCEFIRGERYQLCIAYKHYLGHFRRQVTIMQCQKISFIQMPMEQ